MAVPAQLVSSLKKLAKLPVAKQWKTQYETNEDFGSMDPDLKRLMIVGCTGAGKSSLINRLAGSHCSCKEREDGTVSNEWDAEPVFKVGNDTNAVTQHTAFANLHFLGNEERPFICVDTPGHDDPGGVGMAADSPEGKAAREYINQQAGDLFVKLKRMRFVNSILILHNDVHSNRLNPATYEVLHKIDEMFAESEHNVWEHVIVAYSKCDAETKTWRAGLAKKVADMQAEIKKRFPKCKNIDVPVVSVSSVEFEGKETDMSGFDKIWSFVQTSASLSTEKLVEFKGLSDKIKDILSEKELAQRQLLARKNFNALAMTLLAFIVGFFMILHPFINMKGIGDELMYLAIFVYCIGMTKFYDFLNVAWEDYASGFLRSKGLIPDNVATNKKED